ncbi:MULTISPECIES: LemA family protein [Segatella]|jgi:LemA protein|uniref:LemA protein n=2 Tax=Segatella TaxID=2974251 RepID=D8DW18_9BACT|nr:MULTISPECIES: LemA family protein [Segatella]MEE3416139.1 LemA family protein [Prevotella sp.]EFI72353.1 LemA protein [Segatella baroniae B14]MDR4932208.1 LemA family protein [Segatella bryantii]OYP54604.1 LemA family protein [Segatella bryantii]UKK72479.1 LemA family protein [Segatella bryantii]
MKKTLIIILAVVAVFAIWAVSTYNSLVGEQQKVEEAWAQVENVYQRRADLIPNLVETVKGYAKHEKETLEGVIQARANATSVKVDANTLDEASMKKFQDAQGELGSALSRLLVVQERYPDLKANENFKELQAQLEGTENRITVERKNFNEIARSYNTSVKTFPKNIFAGMFGFQAKPYFQAQAGADKAPKVSFD